MSKILKKITDTKNTIASPIERVSRRETAAAKDGAAGTAQKRAASPDISDITLPDIAELDVKEELDEDGSPKRFLANNKYFTISVYALIVIFFGALIIKCVLSWDDTVATVKNIFNLLMPFIIGGLLAFILNPAVNKLMVFFKNVCKIKSLKVQRVLSIAVTYLLLLGLIIIALFGVIPQIVDSIMELVNAIPQTYDAIYHFFDNLEEHYPDLDVEVVRDALNNALPNIITYLKDFATNIVPAVYNVSVSIVQWVLNIIISLIVSVYMLTDKKFLMKSVKSIIYAFVPVRKIQTTMEILSECNRLFSSFIVGKAVDSLIIGLLCFVFMTLFRLPYTVLISVIVGVTNMIPYFGPFIGAIPGILIMLIVSPVKAIIFAILILVLQQFDGLILGPKILGDSTGVKPLWIIFAITIGGSFAGVLGMFLGVPVIAVLRYLLNRFLQARLDHRNLLAKKQDAAK